MIKIEASTKNLLFALVALLVFLVPLIYSPYTPESYEFPKLYFIYFWALLIFAVFFFEARRPLKVWPKAVWAWLGFSTLSLIFSSHFYTSLWGYYSRFGDCFVALLFMAGISWVFLNAFTFWEQQKLLAVFALSGLVVSVQIVFQHFGWFEPEPLTRAFASFGQPNWAAQFLALPLLHLLYLYLKNRTPFSRLPTGTFPWGVALLYAGLWFTYSLSGILAFFCGLLWLAWQNRKEAVVRKKLGLVVLLFLAISLAFPGIIGAKLHDALLVMVPKVYALQDNYRISDPGFIRLHLWRGTLNLITSSPKVFFLGTGAETFPYAFQPFRPPELNYSSEWEYVFNKPHHYFLEIWAEEGLFGLLSYLAVLWFLWRGADDFRRPLLVSLMVSNFFGWPSVTVALYFWLLVSTKTEVRGDH